MIQNEYERRMRELNQTHEDALTLVQKDAQSKNECLMMMCACRVLNVMLNVQMDTLTLVQKDSQIKKVSCSMYKWTPSLK